jgi:hypothetical protein
MNSRPQTAGSAGFKCNEIVALEESYNLTVRDPDGSSPKVSTPSRHDSRPLKCTVLGLGGEHRQAKHPRRNFADRLGNAVLVSLNKMLKQRPPSLKRRRNDHEQL